MTNLVISNVVIKQDENLRFRLNDLHKASGGKSHKRPQFWLDNPSTKELVAEISAATMVASDINQQVIEPLIVISGGNKQGTYACKELVYAYAMWLSPTFHLHVIRAYDTLVVQEKTELEWKAIRGSVKQEYKNMTFATKLSYEEKGKVAPFFAYTTEADLLNLIVLGMRAKKYKEVLNLDNNANIRDGLNKVQLDAFEFLESHNAVFINAEMEYSERAIKLKGLFDKRFKDKILLSLNDTTETTLIGER
jgi:hypothetical protein